MGELRDLLLHGVLPIHPALAFIMLGATAINGITLFRAFQRAFLGPRPHARSYEETPGLIMRERAVLLSMVVLTVILGVAPNRLIQLREPAVERLLAQVAQGAHGAEEHVAALSEIGKLPAATVQSMLQLAADLAVSEGVQQSGYRLVTNEGPDSGQSVFHLHWHLLGGQTMTNEFA